MKIGIQTQTPQFFPDLCDVVRLFFGEGSAVADGEPCDATLRHTHVEADGLWLERCELSGGEPIACERRAQAVHGGLTEKRLLKRAVKLCCYDLMKRLTGRRPPWGALTGIRPTRLLYAQLEAGDSLEQAERALRDTFDLSQEKAALLREIIVSQRGIVERAPQDVDVYVGIPFCTTRCAYCSFSSGEIGDGRLVEPYLCALFDEIDAARALMDEAGLRLRAVYAGGGTPTALTAAQLARLLARVTRAFPGARELTVEAGRPDTLDADKLRALRDAGVGRISINPQTMNDATLRAIGRAHTARDICEAFALARSLGFDNVNMDVIAALPGETPDDFLRTLEQIRDLAPESLTVHTLAVKRSSRLHERGYRPTGEEDARRMVDMGLQAAHGMGMRAYYLYRQKYMAGNLENVGYALPGCACAYNVDIMEETTSILALGAGGISKRVQEDAQLRIRRAPNVSNIEQYIARVGEMAQRKRALFLEDTP